MAQERIIIPNGFTRRWIVSCAGGELIGIGAAAAIAVGFMSYFGEPETFGLKLLNVVVMLVAGTIEGGMLGWLQWRVLRELFPTLPRGKWVGFTVLVAVLGWMIGTIPSVFLAGGEPQPVEASAPFVEPPLAAVMGLALVGGLALGALFGLFQWFVLRHHAQKASRWILANSLGWGLAMVCIFLAATLPDNETPKGIVIAGGILGGIAAGISVGWVTGIFLPGMAPRNGH